jgi:hypothetical protein
LDEIFLFSFRLARHAKGGLWARRETSVADRIIAPRAIPVGVFLYAITGRREGGEAGLKPRAARLGHLLLLNGVDSTEPSNRHLEVDRAFRVHRDGQGVLDLGREVLEARAELESLT